MYNNVSTTFKCVLFYEFCWRWSSPALLLSALDMLAGVAAHFVAVAVLVGVIGLSSARTALGVRVVSTGVVLRERDLLHVVTRWHLHNWAGRQQALQLLKVRLVSGLIFSTF